MSLESQYATFYRCSLANSTLSLTVSEMWPVFHWTFYRPSFNHNLKMLPLRYRWLKFCMPKFNTHGQLFVQKVSPTYDLKLSHNRAYIRDRRTDGQADRRQTWQWLDRYLSTVS